MDEVSKKLLQLLRENSRASLTELAKKLGISNTAVKKRIEKLVKKGVIQGFTVKINPMLAGKKKLLAIAHIPSMSYPEFVKLVSSIGVERAYVNPTGETYVAYLILDEGEQEKLKRIRELAKMCLVSKVDVLS